MKLLIITLLFISGRAIAIDHWFCEYDNSFKEGNLYAVCGVGTFSTEGEARVKALDNAMNEFNTLCKNDYSCKNRKFSIEPRRSTCSENKSTNISRFEKFTCHRLFVFAIQ